MKIHIIGAVGSGKTTLGKQLATQYEVPFFELDQQVWERLNDEDHRKSPEEIQQYITNITHLDSWVTEGVHMRSWVEPLLQQADIIIYYNIPYVERKKRIKKRFFKQLLKIEKANYKPTYNMYKKFHSWNNAHLETGHKQVMHLLEPYREKVLEVIDKEELYEKKILLPV